MSLLSAVIIGLAIGFVVGGRPKNLGNLSLRWNVLIFLALAIQLVMFTGLTVAPMIVTAGYIASWLLALVWLGRNLSVAGIPVVLLGGVSNVLAIASNGGRMPVEASLLARTHGSAYVAALAAGHVTSNSILATPQTNLRWLTDIILIPPPWPLPTVLSVGDVLIALGVVWLIAAAMRTPSQVKNLPTPLRGTVGEGGPITATDSPAMR